MAITPLPSAPLTTDNPVVFNTKAFAWVGALDTFTTEANGIITEVNTAASAASTAKTDAEAAAASAVATANVTKWVSGTTYDEGDAVWSPSNFLTYRRKSTGSGTTDPSIDTTNWEQIAGTGNVTLDGIQILTNKTITGLKETKVAVASSDINLASGNYFTKTISGATTFTVSNTASSGSVSAFILDLTNGGSDTITWFSGVTWAAGTAPTLTASGRDVLGFFTHDGGTTWSGLVLGLAMA